VGRKLAIIAVETRNQLKALEKLGYHSGFAPYVGFLLQLYRGLAKISEEKKLGRYLGHFACASGEPLNFSHLWLQTDAFFGRWILHREWINVKGTIVIILYYSSTI